MTAPTPRVKLGLYQHYKGRHYRLLEVARHTETKEQLAVYHKVHEPGRLWARPLAMFAGTVLHDGHEVPRFRRVRLETDPDSRRHEVRRARRAPSVRGSRTSRGAARAAQAKAPSMRERIHRAVCAAGAHGCIREELQLQLHMKHQTVGARVKELIDDGLLLENGRQRKTTTGRWAEVLVAPAQ